MITVAVAIPVFYFLTDFPKDAKFLSAADKQYVLDRLTYDIGRPVKQNLTVKFVVDVLNDPRLWLLSVTVYTALTVEWQWDGVIAWQAGLLASSNRQLSLHSDIPVSTLYCLGFLFILWELSGVSYLRSSQIGINIALSSFASISSWVQREWHWQVSISHLEMFDSADYS